MGASFLKNRVQENDVITLAKRRKYNIIDRWYTYLFYLFLIPTTGNTAVWSEREIFYHFIIHGPENGSSMNREWPTADQ